MWKAREKSQENSGNFSNFNISPFHATFVFLHPLKTLEKRSFLIFDVHGKILSYHQIIIVKMIRVGNDFRRLPVFFGKFDTKSGLSQDFAFSTVTPKRFLFKYV